jgi:2-amino-4-hydroxy-6-hydroxymethyldihydropteridine diphosphokinase
MRQAYIGLGANQGDLVATLNAAVQSLSSLEQSKFVAASPFYRSAPIEASGPDYLNAVVRIDTELEPYGLLLHLLEIEMMFGRKRGGGADSRRNAPRNIDLDLLMVGDLIIRSAPLVLPHPRMHERAFVLRPLLDLAPDLMVPGHGSAAHLLSRVSDQIIAPFSPENGADQRADSGNEPDERVDPEQEPEQRADAGSVPERHANADGGAGQGTDPENRPGPNADPENRPGPNADSENGPEQHADPAADKSEE